jgi:hypothetical protein
MRAREVEAEGGASTNKETQSQKRKAHHEVENDGQQQDNAGKRIKYKVDFTSS